MSAEIHMNGTITIENGVVRTNGNIGRQGPKPEQAIVLASLLNSELEELDITASDLIAFMAAVRDTAYLHIEVDKLGAAEQAAQEADQ